MARCLTCSMNCLTTGSATSASSSAMRTSRRAALTFSSVSRALPVMPRRVAVSFSDRLSNMMFQDWLAM
jgi:hypothetical protein